MAYPPTPYFPLQVAAALRFTNTNGDLVTQLYPVDSTQAGDTPQTGYISLIGANVGNLVTQYQSIVQILNNYGTSIATLQTDVTNILTSGATFIPTVNGGCLSTPVNAVIPVDTAATLLIANSCAYNTALGTPTALAQAVLAETSSTLNTLAAYSQNSAMAALVGWDSSPATIAASLKNLWTAYLDIRTGVTQALIQSAITCADVVLKYQGVYNMVTRTITMYFYGSSIPTNFSGSGSSSGTFIIYDTAGNTYTQTFNLYTTVSGVGYVTLSIGSSGLYQNSAYTSILQYALVSTTPSLGCNGGLPGVVMNNTQTCPNLTATALSSTQVQFTFTPTILENATYTIDLLNTSGTTSGTTVLGTKVYNNPGATTTDHFNNLVTATLYWVRSSVTVSTITTVCPSTPVTTS